MNITNHFIVILSSLFIFQHKKKSYPEQKHFQVSLIMNINTALKFLVAFEAVRSGVHAQSVVVDQTSDTNVADAALLDVVLENLRVVVDPVTRGDGSSSKTGCGCSIGRRTRNSC